ncbi:MAG TPA: transglycosylase SLT domain-containing protein [Bacteroidales bacterium]|nr:transglycosylase SLT domain-containing protein [Bacteroidales bacterium]
MRTLLFLVILIPNYFLVWSQKKAEKDSIPVFPDLVYEIRFAKLHKASAIDLEFNPLVKKYIELFTIQRRKDMSRILGLSQMYFPIFEEYLNKYNLPLELKYLPLIESGLDPLARSSSGAVGLWQFLYHSANMFDLKMTSFVDERSDVYKSTDAACKYLKYLYHTYNNWHLVLSSFNGGPGVVRNAMERSGGKASYADLSSFFPEETKNYVPAFMAMIYVMNYAAEHNLVAQKPLYSFSDLDTVNVKYNLQFSQISEVVNLPVETIRYLNPVYKLDVITESDLPQTLVLPKDKIGLYLRNENKLFANSLQRSRIPEARTSLQKTIYTVKQGDFLHKIAMQNECSLEELKRWNNLKNDSVSIGQHLVIWTEKKTVEPDLVNH